MAKKVLVVDDDPVILESVVSSLEMLKCNYEFFTAGSGEEALELIKKEKPNLLILDLMMPGMSGFKLATLVQNNPELKDIPVIMLTANSEVANKEMGSLVAKYYIQKPFDPKDLKQKVESVIGT